MGVLRGECQFSDKAAFALLHGATGLIVIDDIGSRSPLIMAGNGTNYTFPIVGVRYRKRVFEAALDTCTVWHYTPPLLDPSEVIMLFFATGLVALGAFYSTIDLHKSPLVSAAPEVVVMSSAMFPILFVIVGSAALVLLFFFMKYAIHFILLVFCVGGGYSLYQMVEPFVSHYFPRTKHGVCSLRVSGIIATVFSVAIVALFTWYRSDDRIGWLFQDIMAVGLLCHVQKSLQLPSVKLATILLSMLFFYDIFWVFLSPLLFTKSVMMEVATGGGTGESVPMLLVIPSLLDDLPSSRMLGYGDVALPGLFISYLRRHDIITKRIRWSGYFYPGVLSYLVGLSITFTALKIMKVGQPALLYLVPCTLGATFALGCKRHDMGNLWRGVQTPSDHKELMPLAEDSEDSTKQE